MKALSLATPSLSDYQDVEPFDSSGAQAAATAEESPYQEPWEQGPAAKLLTGLGALPSRNGTLPGNASNRGSGDYSSVIPSQDRPVMMREPKSRPADASPRQARLFESVEARSAGRQGVVGAIPGEPAIPDRNYRDDEADA
jgi:hypothetical protein